MGHERIPGIGIVVGSRLHVDSKIRLSTDGKDKNLETQWAVGSVGYSNYSDTYQVVSNRSFPRRFKRNSMSHAHSYMQSCSDFILLRLNTICICAFSLRGLISLCLYVNLCVCI